MITPTNLFVGGSVGVCAGLIVLLFILIRKNSPAQPILPVTAAWIDELSVERYRPMMRLLDSRDVARLFIEFYKNPKTGEVYNLGGWAAE